MKEEGKGEEMKGRYRINEVFCSLQGEGVRAGTPNVFVRFSGCNLECRKEEGPKSPGGFDCDTEFASGRWVTLDELHAWIVKESPSCRWLILTGGEPGLQLDRAFIDYFQLGGYKLAIETNGSIELLHGLDWITVSPKVAEHAIRQRTAHEVKYVRAWGQGIPKTAVTADHYLISPAFSGGDVSKETLQWCINLCLENPKWRLSVQQHKKWNVR